MSIGLVDPLGFSKRWPLAYLVSRPLEDREEVISSDHMDVTWWSSLCE